MPSNQNTVLVLGYTIFSNYHCVESLQFFHWYVDTSDILRNDYND